MYRSIKWKPFKWLIASFASSGLSNTTYAVPLVLRSDDVPILTCRIGPYLPNRSYKSAPVMLKLLLSAFVVCPDSLGSSQVLDAGR